MRIIKISLVIFLISASVWADGGSLYTRKGIGDLYFALNARRFSLGGGGIALKDVVDFSSLNPAGWYSIKRTRFDAGMYYNASALSNSSSSVKYAQAKISGFSIAVPVDTTKGIVLAGGLVPYSNVMYEVDAQESDPLVGSYKAIYEGSGGINKIFAGISFNLPLDFSVGAAFEYYYGRIEYNSNSIMADVQYKNGIFKDLDNYQGTAINAGIITPDLSRIFGSKDISDLHLGLSVNSFFLLKRDSSEVSGSSDSTFVSSSVSQKINMPVRLGYGLSVKLFNRYQIVADYIYQPFAQYSVNNIKPGVYQNLNRYSAGVEYANPNPDKESYWDRVTYRLGVSFENSQYFMNSTSINQYAMYAGFSLPFGNIYGGTYNTIDIGLQYGERGTTSNNLIKEKFFTLNVGISMGELWFIRTER